MTFELNDIEEKRAMTFTQEHINCKACSLGEKFMISFIPTGLGDLVSIRCLSCGSICDITDKSKL